MGYVTASCCLLLAILGYKICKKLYNPTLIFGSIWCFVTLLSSLPFFGLDHSNENTYEIILLGIFCFFIGFILTTIVSNLNYKVCESEQEMKSILTANCAVCNFQYRQIYIVAVLCIIFKTIDFGIMLKYLIEGGLFLVRDLAKDQYSILYERRGGLENVIRNVCITPFVYAIVSIATVDFFMGNKKKLLCTFMIVLVILTALTEGGRIIIVNLVLHIILVLFICNRKINVSKKMLTFFLVIAVAAIYVMTLSRNFNETPLEVFYYYFSLSVPLLDYWISATNDAGTLGYGLVSLQGIINPFLNVLIPFIGFEDYPNFWMDVQEFSNSFETYIKVGWYEGRLKYANAFVTSFLSLYVDGRYIGIILGMIVYGSLCAVAYYTVIFNRSYRAICFYGIIVQGLVFSFIRFPFSNPSYALSFIYIWLAFVPIVSKTKLPKDQRNT